VSGELKQRMFWGEILPEPTDEDPENYRVDWRATEFDGWDLLRMEVEGEPKDG
jgi:hypothetical protein